MHRSRLPTRYQRARKWKCSLRFNQTPVFNKETGWLCDVPEHLGNLCSRARSHLVVCLVCFLSALFWLLIFQYHLHSRLCWDSWLWHVFVFTPIHYLCTVFLLLVFSFGCAMKAFGVMLMVQLSSCEHLVWSDSKGHLQIWTAVDRRPIRRECQRRRARWQTLRDEQSTNAGNERSPVVTPESWSEMREADINIVWEKVLGTDWCRYFWMRDVLPVPYTLQGSAGVSWEVMRKF